MTSVTPASPTKRQQLDSLSALPRAAPGRVPRQSRVWPLWVSLAAHGLLGLGLMSSVAWKTTPPAALQAELWDALPAVAMAEPAPLPPAPELPAKSAPMPEPEPEAIAPKVVKPMIEAVKKEPKESLKKEPIAKPAPDDKAQRAADNLANETARAKETARLTALLDPSAAPKQASTQAGNLAALGANWGAKLKACVQPHMRFTQTNNPNLKVEIAVQLLPSGAPNMVRFIKRSGVPAFDDAVERAVLLCDPFPRPESGVLPSNLNIIYKLND